MGPRWRWSVLIEEHRRVLAESLAGYAEECPDVVVTRHLPDGGAVSALVDMSVDAAAVVVGSRGRSGPRVLAVVARCGRV